MEPVTASLAAISLLMNEQNSLNAQGTAADNLSYQKQKDAQAQDMAGATKIDANGNKTVYDPATNTWKVILSPMQQAIQDASQSEQYKTLTTDAQRKRELAQRNEQYSLDAGTPYNEAIQNYLHNQPKSTAADEDQLQTLMAGVNQASGKQNQALIERQALRLGRGADIPSLIKATDDSLGASTPSTMLSARQQALQEHASQVQQHDQQYLPEIQTFKNIINQGGGGASTRFSDLSPQVANAEQTSNAAMLAALNNGSTNINSASKSLATTQQKALDFNPMIKALTAAQSKKNADGTTTTADGMPDYSGVADYLNNIPQNIMSDYIS